MIDKIQSVLAELISRQILPQEDIFEVTEELTERYFSVHREIFPPKTRKLPKPSDIRYAKKLAALNLMRLNESRFIATAKIVEVEEETKLKQKCGFVYVITNPAYPGVYKVGMTSDTEARLKTYQTYDPYRRFKIEHYVFVNDRRKSEKMILDKFAVDIVGGEWVSNDRVKQILIALG